MSYTIKQLAKLSGVSTRTLRFYDEINLLKPAYLGENQYRYYEEKQILLLQQILFYRELDYSLKDIKKILSNSTFNTIYSMQSQKMMLQDKLKKIGHMLETIDKTVAHLRGELSMQVEEFFDPIKLSNRNLQKEYENYLVSKGVLTQKQMDESWQKIKNWSSADWEKFKGNGDLFYRKMAQTIDLNLPPEDEQVQSLVHQHYLLIKPLWIFSKKSYLKLANAYQEDKNFQKFCELYHLKLHDFLVQAMQIYAENQLK